MSEPDDNSLDVEAIRNMRLRSILRYWQEKRGLRKMPSRKDLDPMDVPHLLPIVLLADFYDAHPRIRLLGTEATAACGFEPRGKFVQELPLGRFTETWIDAFGVLAANSAPVATESTFAMGGTVFAVQSILAPLSSDGATVDQVFGGLVVARHAVISAPPPTVKTFVRAIGSTRPRNAVG